MGHVPPWRACPSTSAFQGEAVILGKADNTTAPVWFGFKTSHDVSNEGRRNLARSSRPRAALTQLAQIEVELAGRFVAVGESGQGVRSAKGLDLGV
jgi:hypothetical protein